MTELHEFSALGDEEAVQDLIYRGVNVSEKDVEWGGRTPLHWAVTNGHYFVTKSLINAGASINARMNNGWTPLHCAVEAGHKKIAQLLLDSGSHPFASDRFNDTPFDVARIYKREEILEVLEKHTMSHADSLTLEEEEKKLELEEDFGFLADPGSPEPTQ